MALISSNDQLTALIPNVMVTVKGEADLYTKIAPFLSIAEGWLIENFTDQEVFNAICAMEDDKPAKVVASQMVATEAFRQAVPSLDLILTPNGFGIVSNSNIAPASKERVERLLVSLLDRRDALIDQLLPLLYAIATWHDTAQCRFFAATMFPTLAVTKNFPRPSEGRWEQYLAIRQTLIPIEDFFATHYLSHELLDVLRQEVQSGSYRAVPHKYICELLQAVEVRCLKADSPQAQTHREHHILFEIVDTIRDTPEFFAEWHGSDTAKLYSPTIFENKKESNGYWF